MGEQPLWKSDGTAAGTVRIGDLTGWNILYFTAVNGTFFFAAVDPNDGYRALWKTDGTARDTVGLAGFDQDPGDNPTAINGTLFFIANGGGSPERIGELWKSDGTVTERVAALGPRIESDRFGWDHWNLTNVNGTLFFFSGHELWKSDGTAGGTLPVAAITPAFATYQWSLFELREVNGALFFAGCESLGRCELWRSDGTTAGTVRVVTFDAGSHLDEMNLPQLTSASGMLFFSACDPTTGTDCALWKSDGTPEGTVLVKDIVPDLGRGLSVNVNGTLFFRAYEPGAGIRVWKTDGTAEGTVPVSPGYSYPFSLLEFTDVEGTLFYVVYDYQNFLGELWKIDARGALQVTDFAPGSGLSYPSNLKEVNGTLFFMAFDPGHGRELWALPLTTSPKGKCGAEHAQAISEARTAADQACNAQQRGCRTARSHADYVFCIAAQVRLGVKSGQLPPQCAASVRRCAPQSSCGKPPGWVTCCIPRPDGQRKCQATKHAASCTRRGGSVSDCPSCCDAWTRGVQLLSVRGRCREPQSDRPVPFSQRRYNRCHL